MAKVYILPEQLEITVPNPISLMKALQDEGIYINAPCGGNGKCGKCKVMIDGEEVLACETVIERNMTVRIPEKTGLNILQGGIPVRQHMDPVKE